MKNESPTTVILLSVTGEVRKALNTAKKKYPTLSEPEILKLGLSKIVTEYADAYPIGEERNEIRSNAAHAVGQDYLDDETEDSYTADHGTKVSFS